MTATMRRRPSWSDGNWRDESSCRTEPIDLFFPSGFGLDARVRASRAKAICRSCPVRAECLEFALATYQDHGIWGGFDDEERRVLRRRRRAMARAASAAPA